MPASLLYLETMYSGRAAVTRPIAARPARAAIFALAVLALAGCAPEKPVTSRVGTTQIASTIGTAPFDGRYIDAHMHVHAHSRSGGAVSWDMESAANAALAAMDRFGVAASLIMPPPFSPGHDAAYDFEILTEAVRKHPDRFAFLGGGGLLNPLIHAAQEPSQVTADLRRQFAGNARAILGAGARGFGEMTALHLSMNERHPFLEARPDHPLFLLLADIAARAGVPIDLHMEAVPENMDTPRRFLRRSPNNPARLGENIHSFERLLAHNRAAPIIWTHAGWNNTGHRTPALMGRLLDAHPNLFMSIKIRDRGGRGGSPLTADGGIRPAWLRLLADYPNRFLMAADQHYYVPGRGRQRQAERPAKRFFGLLPPALQRRIGHDNAVRLFGLR